MSPTIRHGVIAGDKYGGVGIHRPDQSVDLLIHGPCSDSVSVALRTKRVASVVKANEMYNQEPWRNSLLKGASGAFKMDAVWFLHGVDVVLKPPRPVRVWMTSSHGRYTDSHPSSPMMPVLMPAP